MQQQMQYVMESLDPEKPALIFGSLDDLFREAVKMHGQFTPTSRDQARDIVEGRKKVAPTGSVFRFVDQADGTRVSVIVMPAVGFIRK